MSDKLQIQKLTITGRQLALIPTGERLLFVYLSNLNNTISTLRKLLIYTWDDVDQDVLRHGYITQQSTVLKLLIGNLNEGWTTLQKIYFKNGLKDKYVGLGIPELDEHQRVIEDYFGGEDLINQIRNKLAFHFDHDKVVAQLKNLDPDMTSQLYLSNQQGNCLYFVGEEIVGQTMLELVSHVLGESDPRVVFDTIYKETLEVSRAFQRFGHSMILSIVLKYLNGDDTPEQHQIELQGLRPVEEIKIPFFVGNNRKSPEEV